MHTNKMDIKTVAEFKHHFDQVIFEPLNRLISTPDYLIGFIFISCAIDYLSGFWWGADTRGHVKKAYTGFIKQYFPFGKYDETDIYESLRNGLVHLFTIKGKRYALVQGHSESHLKMDGENNLILNASNFVDDLYFAKERYFEEAEANSILKEKLFVRLNRDGFLIWRDLQENN